MGFRTYSAVFLALVISGCATTNPAVAPTEAAVPIAPDCRVARATGDVAALLRISGELVVVGGGIEVLRSKDVGRSWWREKLPLNCRWPDITEVHGRLLASCSEHRPPKRLLVMTEDSGEGWAAPVVVDSTADLVIDTRLQTLPGDELLLFATHIDRPDALDDSIYTLRAYRSADRGASWSEAENVVVGRRGEHVEDTRSALLADGTVLLAYEVESAEAAPSRIHQRRSADGGRSWSEPLVIWSGADVEPGGYLVFPDGELWFIASTDEEAGGGSYDRALIKLRRSLDDGLTWTSPVVLVNREDQLSFGGVLLPGGEILLPSVRHYNDRKSRQLSIYLVDREPNGGASCAVNPISSGGFEKGLDPHWIER